ncbi:MAG: PilX N-terminal domain-containing pilus assembly protein [Candidatus Angelobacter sp.]
MHRDKIINLRSKRRQSRRSERGVALITTLLLLMLLTGLTLTMAWSARSDMLINGYYRNFRGSFYAADSGLNTIRQAVVNEFVPGASLPVVFAAGVQPIPPGTEGAIAAKINAAYGAYQKINGTGQATNSWPGKFRLPTATSFTLTEANCTVTGTPAAPVGKPWTCTNLPPNTTLFTYVYNYSTVIQGQSQGGENSTLADRGQITLTATVVNASSKTSFAAWGMFIDQYSICDGSTLVPGTISGPVFTNGSWNFGAGTYKFTGTVGSAGTKAGYQNGACQQIAGPSGNGITPTFQQGFNLGQPTVPLPTNDFNQQRAVLDGKGTAGQPTQAELNSTLRDAKGNPYPAAGKPATGVFLPVSTASGTPTLTGGGLMVEGDASVVLTPSGTAGQIYQITQGNTVTTVTIDPTPVLPKFPNGTTVVKVNGTAQPTISGVPTMFDPATGSPQGYDTMLYVDGNISALSGPAQGQPAINDGTALTITAAKNVTVTGDLLYKSEPVTLAASGSTPADTLIPANDHGQTLGIFTSTGDIVLNDTQVNPKTGKFDGVMEIDASLATISNGGTGGLTNPNGAINTLTIVGGRIQNNIKNINTATRNVLFDVRYAGGSFSPPWFPSTNVSLGGLKQANFNTPIIQRLSWQNQTAYY